MKNKTLLFVFLGLIVVILPIFTAGATQGKVYKWTFICPHSRESAPWVFNWMDGIAEAVKGRLDLKLLGAGEHPYKFGDMVPAVSNREAEMTISLGIVMSVVAPKFGLVELPFLLGCDATEALIEDPEFSDVFHYTWLDPLDKWNLMSLGTCFQPAYIIHFDDFLTSTGSLKGKKIRAVSPETAALVAQLGGVPVSVSGAETYMALQRGTIDGVITTVDSALMGHYFEVAPYATLTNMAPGLGGPLVNKDAWAELPPDLQDTILKASAEMQEVTRQWFSTRMESDILKAMKEQGARFMVIRPDFRENLRNSMRPVWDKWADRAGPGAAKMIKRVDQFLKKYEANQ